MLEVGSGHFDAHRGFNAGGQHIDTGFDRHHPGVSQAGEFHQRVQLFFERVGGHPLAPFIPRFELDKSFDHGQRRRVGGRFCTTDFTEYTFYLRHGGNQLVRLLQNFPRFTNGQPGIGGGHIHQVALIQRRDKFAANFAHRPEADDRHHQSQCQRGFGVVKHRFQRRHVDGNQCPIQRVFVLRQDLAANKIAHQHRHQGNCQCSTGRHGVSLGEGQR